MWMLSNRTPYAVQRNWFLSKDASKNWVVGVKATFDVRSDGTTKLAACQEKVLYAEEYYGEAGKSSLRYDGDLGGPKQKTDVILNGHAYSPRGRRAAEVMVTMTVHDISKTLRVSGDRRWTRGVAGLAISSPEPFDRMPLRYERAFGGVDTRADDPREHRLERRNPVGRGFAVRPEHVVDQLLPNVEYPDEPIASWRDRPRPAGLGVVASYWAPRLDYAGTYDERWKQERFPLPPNDLDDRFLQCVPPDQQSSSLRGGERVELVNLTPGGRLAFTLPRIRLGFETRLGHDRVRHQARLHSVILEPDVPRVMLVWHTTVPCPTSRVDYLDATMIFEKEYL